MESIVILTLNASDKKVRLFVPADVDVNFSQNRITVILFKTRGSNGNLIVNYDKYRGFEREGGQGRYEKYGKFTIKFHEDKSASIKTPYPGSFFLHRSYPHCKLNSYCYYVELKLK